MGLIINNTRCFVLKKSVLYRASKSLHLRFPLSLWGGGKKACEKSKVAWPARKGFKTKWLFSNCYFKVSETF